VAVARFSSGGVAICYVLPVLWHIKIDYTQTDATKYIINRRSTSG